jgi:hypothetical protein
LNYLVTAVKNIPRLLASALLLSVATTTLAESKDQDSAKKIASVKQQSKEVAIPEDLLADEHLREEFGVNYLTTPSIDKLFELLDTLGTLSYDKLSRTVPEETPTDRLAVSLSLGALIADGFLVVQCEKIEQMENVGRSLLKHAKVLGAGMRMNRHSQSLLEQSLKGDWKNLRMELSKTQFDVEAEMVQLRDVDIAHLISLGGWLRAFQIGTHAADMAYNPEKTRNLARADIAGYYLQSLESLSDTIQRMPIVRELHQALEDLMPLVDGPEGKSLTQEEVKALKTQADKLMKIVSNVSK